MRPCWLIPILACACFAQLRDVYRVGPGVVAPKVTHKQQPRYTREAFYARVQGKVVCEVIVDELGKPVRVSVLSPLGFGLDEQAQAAVRRWEFKPGTKDGVPAKVVSTFEVSFRFPGTWFDDKAEKKRTAFNVAIANLSRRDKTLAQEAAKSLEDLARQKYPPAMFLFGTLRYQGELTGKDPAEALALIEASSEKGYAPAMANLGMLYIEGKEVAPDVEKGLGLLRDAATLGSTQAQLYLGRKYETGDLAPRDPDRARRYFRLCATTGNRACQLRLATLMLEAPDRKEWEYLQAVTWALLAADRGSREAGQIVEAEMPKLTPEQVEWVRKLKGQLARPAPAVRR